MGKSLDENGVLYLWNKIKEKFATKDVATQSANGLLSSIDKTKLDGIATGATKTEKSSTNGNIKINGRETVVYTHPSGTNPHGTTKSDVGLGNVGNFKAVSTVASQGLTDTEKSNARANIGAGTSNFSGNYNDLTNKPTIPTVGNGTITIKQAGISKGTFTMNQSGDTTIELTDSDTTYPLATTDHNGLMSTSDKNALLNATYCLGNITLFNAYTDSDGGHLQVEANVPAGLLETEFLDTVAVQNLINGSLESYVKNTDSGLMTDADKNAVNKIKSGFADINSITTEMSGDGATYSLRVNSVNGGEAVFLDSNSVQSCIDTSLNSYVKKTDVSNVYKYKGSVATVADLPASGNSVGDTYNVSASDMNYSWNGTAWDALGGTFTIEYLTNAEIDNLTK